MQAATLRRQVVKGIRESFMATIIGKKVVLTDKEIEALIDYLWKL